MVHQFRRDRTQAQEWAEAAITLAPEHGFPPWLGQATVIHGWALAEEEQVEDGFAQIQQDLVADQAAAIRQFHSYLFVLLADAYGKTGQQKKGLPKRWISWISQANGSGRRHSPA